eukprot:TRINITY_DN18848_c0_g1_i2.p1 TRINITY_DN18848_c0_g1~~TRINITY_DN18848_c0_g1_i2.p1  ORF type:complete len:357 (-),score=81.68 TRINITY_DN18848_c0_g1_i2:47-1117(-)
MHNQAALLSWLIGVCVGLAAVSLFFAPPFTPPSPGAVPQPSHIGTRLPPDHQWRNYGGWYHREDEEDEAAIPPPPLPPTATATSVFVGVLSCVACAERRAALRGAWLRGVPRAFRDYGDGEQSRFAGFDNVFVRYSFLVAHRYDNPELERSVRQEAKEEGDIVQFPIADGRGMPMAGKTLEFITWIGPANFTWVVKCDDDTYVHVHRLFERLLSVTPRKTYFGYQLSSPTWADGMKEMYDHPYYGKRCVVAPTYMSGSLYALSWDVVRPFSLVGREMAIVGHEDLTVGLWALAIYQLKYISDERIHAFLPGARGHPIQCTEDVIVQHYLSPAQILAMHALEVNGTAFCKDNLTFNF